MASQYMEIDNCYYRKNVAAIIFRKDGKVLFCERKSGNKLCKFSHKWQFPQGGVDVGETSDDAVLREIQEETGLTSLEIVFKDDIYKPYNYPYQKKISNEKIEYVCGQAQKWFLLKFTGAESEIKIPSDEFVNYKWVDLDFDLINDVIPFKHEVYNYIIKKVSPILDKFIKNN